MDAAERAEQTAVVSPGPWRPEYDSCDCGDGYGCPHGQWIHGITGPVRPDGKSWAITEFAELSEPDARLMAAAPELRDLVERAVALDRGTQIAADFAALMAWVVTGSGCDRCGEPAAYGSTEGDELCRRCWLDLPVEPTPSPNASPASSSGVPQEPR